ncbi:MAG: hypothetical protein GTN69_10535 [Armatimonadetes bacterium]|nr:hypothetical protein [Armatimonadota bacterium]
MPKKKTATGPSSKAEKRAAEITFAVLMDGDKATAALKRITHALGKPDGSITTWDQLAHAVERVAWDLQRQNSDNHHKQLQIRKMHTEGVRAEAKAATYRDALIIATGNPAEQFPPPREAFDVDPDDPPF